MTPATSSETLTQPIAPPDTAPQVEDPPYRRTPEQEARFAAYMAAPKVLPRSATDPETGRAMPASKEDRAARWEEFKRSMAEINAEDDDPPMSLEQFQREMNDERRANGERLLYLEP